MIQTLSSRLRVLALGILFAAAACGEPGSPTAAPEAPAGVAEAPVAGIGEILDAPQQVQTLLRATPLAAPVSASREIGIFGGWIGLPGTGGSIFFPPGAVTRPTRITMTAPAGAAVAYEFAPHGINFIVPPIITQELNGIAVPADARLFAGYFANLADVNLATGVGAVTELLDVSTSFGLRTARFPIGHFSGYLIATGRSRGGDDFGDDAGH